MKWSPFSSLFERRLNALPIMQMWVFIVNPDVSPQPSGFLPQRLRGTEGNKKVLKTFECCHQGLPI